MRDEKPAPPPAPAPKCPVCGEPFERATLVLCRDCDAPHHRRCWAFNKGCSTYACRSRAFVLPPVGRTEVVEYTVRGEFSPWLYLGIFAAVTALFAAAGVLVGPVLGFGKDATIGVFALWATVCWFPPLIPAITDVVYRLVPEEEAIYLEYRLGGLKIGKPRVWRRFSDVRELEVTTGQRHHQHGETRVLETWLVDNRGERHRIDVTPASAQGEALEAVDLAADLLDTTVSLPRGLRRPAALPPGLSQVLASLPAGGTADSLPETPGERDGDGTDSDAG